MNPSRGLPFFVPALLAPGAVIYGLVRLFQIEAVWLFIVLGTMLTLASLLLSWTLSGLKEEVPERGFLNRRR